MAMTKGDNSKTVLELINKKITNMVVNSKQDKIENEELS